MKLGVLVEVKVEWEIGGGECEMVGWECETKGWVLEERHFDEMWGGLIFWVRFMYRSHGLVGADFGNKRLFLGVVWVVGSRLQWCQYCSVYCKTGVGQGMICLDVKQTRYAITIMDPTNKEKTQIHNFRNLMDNRHERKLCQRATVSSF